MDTVRKLVSDWTSPNCDYRKIFCYSRKNLLPHVKRIWTQWVLCRKLVTGEVLHVCTYSTLVCMSKGDTRGTVHVKTDWVQKICQQLNQVKFDVYVVISYTIALECSVLSLSETIPSVCLTSHVFLELRWDISGDSVRQWATENKQIFVCNFSLKKNELYISTS